MGNCAYDVEYLQLVFWGKTTNNETTVSVHGDMLTYVTSYYTLFYVLHSIDT